MTRSIGFAAACAAALAAAPAAAQYRTQEPQAPWSFTMLTAPSVRQSIDLGAVFTTLARTSAYRTHYDCHYSGQDVLVDGRGTIVLGDAAALGQHDRAELVVLQVAVVVHLHCAATVLHTNSFMTRHRNNKAAKQHNRGNKNTKHGKRVGLKGAGATYE